MQLIQEMISVRVIFLALLYLQFIYHIKGPSWADVTHQGEGDGVRSHRPQHHARHTGPRSREEEFDPEHDHAQALADARYPILAARIPLGF